MSFPALTMIGFAGDTEYSPVKLTLTLNERPVGVLVDLGTLVG